MITWENVTLAARVSSGPIPLAPAGVEASEGLIHGVRFGTVNQEPFDDGFRALLEGRLWEAARTLKTAASTQGVRLDAAYFVGIAVFLAGDKDGALEVFRRINVAGRGDAKIEAISADFFRRLGLLIESLGEARGDRLHQFLQRHRLLPWQFVGRLSGDGNWNAVEPWSFSKQATRFFPRGTGEFDDLRNIIEAHVLPGWLPERPLFDRSSSVLTMGSCFAQNLRDYLAEKGLQSDWMFVPPGLNNTFALRNFIDWCVSGERASDAYWYDQHAQGGAVRWEPLAEHQAYRKVLADMSGMVLTVGLAEVWYDERGGGVFWRGVPRSIFDPARHKCRISTVAENRQNLSHIVRRLHAFRPELPIVVTLSPVPLKATFDNRSIMGADCVSKSTLRVAIHELLGEGHANLYYWPSFEIVRWLGSHVETAFFGEDGNTRHVNRRAVRMIVEAFIRHYYAGL